MVIISKSSIFYHIPIVSRTTSTSLMSNFLLEIKTSRKIDQIWFILQYNSAIRLNLGPWVYSWWVEVISPRRVEGKENTWYTVNGLTRIAQNLQLKSGTISFQTLTKLKSSYPFSVS